MFEVSLKNKKSFECSPETTLFEGARNAGILLEHSCLAARCSSCKVRVVDGETLDMNDEFILTEDEKKNGFILSCNAKPLSDISLDIEDLGDVQLTRPKTFPAKINNIEQISPSVAEVTLRMPPKSDFSYLAGQYVNIIKGSVRRSYSIANAPNKEGTLDFLIKNYPGGSMSEYIFTKAKANDLLRVEGPLGTFFYRHSSSEVLVFLATGTGIAPVKALLEEIYLEEENHRGKKIMVIWGSRYPNDLFWTPLFEYENFEFIPVLSRSGDEWEGEIGYVQDILMNKISDFSKVEVYACGSDAMISSAKKTLIQKGLQEHKFHADAFVQSN